MNSEGVTFYNEIDFHTNQFECTVDTFHNVDPSNKKNECIVECIVSSNNALTFQSVATQWNVSVLCVQLAHTLQCYRNSSAPHYYGSPLPIHAPSPFSCPSLPLIPYPPRDWFPMPGNFSSLLSSLPSRPQFKLDV